MIRTLKILSFILVIILLTSCAKESSQNNANEITWLTNLEKAVEIAGKEDKPIFVNFTGSDWCGWCFKLDDEVFSQAEFIQFSQDELVMLELDFPRDIPQSEAVKSYNEAVLRRFQVTGFPTILLLDKTGNEINRTGYQPGGAVEYIAHIKKLIGMI
ncbi:thioredoxin family protein [Candidatus Cloacimonadota bacterium]